MRWDYPGPFLQMPPREATFHLQSLHALGSWLWRPPTMILQPGPVFQTPFTCVNSWLHVPLGSWRGIVNWHLPAPAARVAVHQPAFEVISHPVSENVTGSVSRTASRIWLLMITAAVPSGAKHHLQQVLLSKSSFCSPHSCQSLSGLFLVQQQIDHFTMLPDTPSLLLVPGGFLVRPGLVTLRSFPLTSPLSGRSAGPWPLWTHSRLRPSYLLFLWPQILVPSFPSVFYWKVLLQMRFSLDTLLETLFFPNTL